MFSRERRIDHLDATAGFVGEDGVPAQAVARVHIVGEQPGMNGLATERETVAQRDDALDETGVG